MRTGSGRRRRQPAVPRPGDLVIDGHIRARLLGLHLLDLEAHVVVGSARPAPRQDGPIDGVSREVERPAATPRLGRGPGANGLPLARAQALLEEGSTVLAATRRIR